MLPMAATKAPLASVDVLPSQRAAAWLALPDPKGLPGRVDRQGSRSRWCRQLGGLLLSSTLALSQARRARATKPQEKANKVALITGASTGIGRATAEELCRSSLYSKIFLAGHNEAKTRAAMAEIGSSATNLEYLPLELASFQSVQKAAKQFQQTELPLHTLICNAAVMALPERQTSADGNELQLEVNYLSHFLLVNLLLPQLVKAGAAGDPARTAFQKNALQSRDEFRRHCFL